MALGKRLREARNKRGLTQEELAARMVPPWNQAGISALEARDSDNSTQLFALADALKISPKWLLTGEGPSGLDEPLQPPPKPDELLMQLIDLYGQLSEDGKHELVSYANYRHAQEFPGPSASNPYPDARQSHGVAKEKPRKSER